MKSKISLFVCIAVLATTAWMAAAAGIPGNGGRTPGQVADVVVNTRAVQFLPAVEGVSYALKVAGPDGFFHQMTVRDRNQLVFGLTENYGRILPDGNYTYELQVIQTAPAPGRTRDDRQLAPPGDDTPMQTGGFLVQDGLFWPSSPADREGEGMLDVVHADDVIITGSQCVGFDCLTDGTENFGFDTIKLKENNLQIYFDDTSTTAGFPANDWRIVTNDSSSGGSNYFSIHDSTGSKVPFKIMAGARTSSIFVSSTGRVGFGTATPVLDLHVTRGDTPSLRLEQDTTSGWTAQTWDIAGNESNFFIRDTTGGSKLPFRIQPGTPTNTLTMKNDGKVGIGTWSPAYMLNIVTTGTAANFAIEQSDGARGIISADSSHVFIGAKTNHDFRLVANDSAKMTILPSGNVGIGNNTPAHPLHMASGAHCTAGGTWTNASSIKLKENIHSLPAAEALKVLLALRPVTFNYKADTAEPCVGFIAEEVPELVATKDRQGLSPMDIVAVLTKVVQDQQKTIDSLQRRLEELEKKQQK